MPKHLLYLIFSFWRRKGDGQPTTKYAMWGLFLFMAPCPVVESHRFRINQFLLYFLYHLWCLIDLFKRSLGHQHIVYRLTTCQGRQTCHTTCLPTFSIQEGREIRLQLLLDPHRQINAFQRVSFQRWKKIIILRFINI